MKSWAKIREEIPAESRMRMDERLKKALVTMPLDKMRKPVA